MKCPDCGKEMKKGFLEVLNVRDLLNFGTTVTWYPQEQRDKLFIKKGGVPLSDGNEGWYCDDCMQVVAIYQQRFM